MSNLELKAAIIRCFGSQLNASKALGVGELRLSRIITERVRPTTLEVAKLAELLNVKPEDIFPAESMS